MQKSKINKGESKLYQSGFRESRKKRNRMIAFMVGVAFIGALGFKLATSTLYPAFKKLSVFEFKKVVVDATEHISEKELKNLVGQPSGKNIFELDLNQIKENVKKNPWVFNVKVTRLFPDQIRVDVIEKKPMAILSMEKLYFLDEKAHVIAPIRTQENVDFPILSGFNILADNDREMMLQAYDLMRLYRENQFLNNWPISEIHWKEKQGFIIYTKHPSFEIRLGQDDYLKKISRLERVLKDLYQKDIIPSLVDVNYSKKVVVKVSK